MDDVLSEYFSVLYWTVYWTHVYIFWLYWSSYRPLGGKGKIHIEKGRCTYHDFAQRKSVLLFGGKCVPVFGNCLIFYCLPFENVTESVFKSEMTHLVWRCKGRLNMDTNMSMVIVVCGKCSVKHIINCSLQIVVQNKPLTVLNACDKMIL